MTSALFLCRGAQRRVADKYDLIEEIDWRHANDPLQIEGLEAKLVARFTPASRDLIEIAYCVYAADRLVSRGGADIRGDTWRRQMHLRIPVRDQRWATSPLKGQLESLLDFLTDDQWIFEFTRNDDPDKTQQPLIEQTPFDDRTCVILFSGGLDSLAGAVTDMSAQDHRPLLLSHRSHAVLDARQRELVTRLNAAGGRYEHLSFWLQLKREEREATQRSRSFLFLAAAGVIAHACGIPLVHVFENGIISINLPIAFQVVGARASRTTHPRVLAEMTALIKSVLGSSPDFAAPFINMTKTEVVLVLAKSGKSHLLEFSSSCTRTRWQRADRPHCGVCSQCIDRRFAVEASGLGMLDKTYAKDLFLASLGTMPREAEARGLIDGYVRRYIEVGDLSQQALWEKYPELNELYGYVDNDVLASIHEMYRRQSTQVLSVIEEQIRAHAVELAGGKLPKDCLLQILIADQALAHGPQDRYADRISQIATSAWRTAFAGTHPADEGEVQRQLDAGLSVAGIELDREHPLFTYVVGIGTKPDFSDPRRPVWIEVKYVRKPNATPTKITEAISADLDRYRRRSDLVVFLIYDPDRLIKDPPRFVRELQPQVGALIRVI